MDDNDRYTLYQLKTACIKLGECDAYQSFSRQLSHQINERTHESAVNNAAAGSVVSVIGILVIAIPFVRFTKLYLATIEKMLALFLVGFLGGLLPGAAVSIASCYKHTCTAFEESAFLITALAGMALTLPIQIRLFKARNPVVPFQRRRLAWLVVGTFAVLLGVLIVFLGTKSALQYKERLLLQISL